MSKSSFSFTLIAVVGLSGCFQSDRMRAAPTGPTAELAPPSVSPVDPSEWRCDADGICRPPG